jgi:hypothetical protein
MTIRQRLRGGRVLDAVRVGGEIGAGQADFEAGCFPTTIEGLRRQRMNHGDKRDIRLLAKGEAQAKGAMGGQIADERSDSGFPASPASSSSVSSAESARSFPSSRRSPHPR